MASNGGETLAETTRRLEREAAERAAVAGPTPTAKPKRRSLRVRSIAAIAGGVVLLLVVIVAIAGAVGRIGDVADGGNPFSDDWADYPGTYSSDPREVLLSASKEEVLENIYALQGEFRDRLRDDYGFIWIQDYDERIEPEDNGYGGESMLDSYWSADWVGAAAIDDPNIRSEVIDLWEELTAKYGGTDFYSANDLYADDPQASVEQFGSANRSEQALWEGSSHDDTVHGLTMLVDVFDSTIPVDDDFNGYYKEMTVEIDRGVNATVFVSFTVWADHLLAEDDEQEFKDRVDPYLGRDKPDYRS